MITPHINEKRASLASVPDSGLTHFLFLTMRTHRLTTEDRWKQSESSKKEKIYVTYDHVHRLIEKSALVLRGFRPDTIVPSLPSHLTSLTSLNHSF